MTVWRFLVALWALALVAPASAQPILVGAAASLEDALSEVVKTSPIPVRFNLAATSTIVRQIEARAPIDVILSADSANLDRLEAGGHLLEGTRFDWLENELVLIVRKATPKLAINGPKDLLPLDRLAIPDEAVPVGGYARRHLAKAGVLPRLEGKIVKPDSVRATLSMVAKGIARAGFVYRTDAKLLQDEVEIAYVVPKEDARVVYPVAALAHTRNPAEARAFLEHLAKSESVRRTMERFGFAVISSKERDGS